MPATSGASPPSGRSGALEFGYDAGVISSVPDFHSDSFGQQAVVASLLLGAGFRPLGGGPLSDHLGRKRTLLLAATVCALGALGSAAAPTATMPVAARFVIGLGSARHRLRRRWLRRRAASSSSPQ